jgi:hypothetical protein
LELYLYTLFIEFEPIGAITNDEFEIFIILPFSCYSFGTANPNRPITLLQAGSNLNTSMVSPYYTLTNLVATSTLTEDPFCVQGFNSVVLDPQIATNATNIATNATDISTLSNYVYNSLVPGLIALQGIEAYVNSQVFLMPCLYPKVANVATFDPMPKFTIPYRYSFNSFVMCFDNTVFQPASVYIEITPYSGANTYGLIGVQFQNIQFQNTSQVLYYPGYESWNEIPVGTQLQFNIDFRVTEFGAPLNFNAEYVIYPYVTKRPAFAL